MAVASLMHGRIAWSVASRGDFSIVTSLGIALIVEFFWMRKVLDFKGINMSKLLTVKEVVNLLLKHKKI